MSSDDTASHRLKNVDPRDYPLPPPPDFAEAGFDDIGYYRVPEARRLFDLLEKASIPYRFHTFPGIEEQAEPLLLLVSTAAARRDEVHRIHAQLFGDAGPS